MKNKSILSFFIIVSILAIGIGLLSLTFHTQSQEPKDIEPQSINYTINDINPYDNYVDIEVEYQINRTLNNTTINISPGSTNLQGEIVSVENGEITNQSQINIEKNHSRISYEYRIIRPPDVNSSHRFMSYSKSFMTWMETDLEHTADGQEYNLVDYNLEEDVNIGIFEKSQTNESIDNTPVYQNPRIAYDENAFVVTNDEGIRDPDINIRKYNYDQVDYTVINTTTNRETPLSPLFEESQVLFNTKDNNYSNTLFIISSPPSDFAGGALSRSSQNTTLWVTSPNVSDERSITVGHEILHSSQTYSLDSDMQWWIEGSAEYIGGIMEIRAYEDINRDETSQDKFALENWSYEDRSEENQTSELSDPDTWEDLFDYNQGARLAYIIDTEIRNETDGHKNIIDLHHWMKDEDSLGYQEFRDKIRKLTSEEFAGQLDNYVTKSEPIEIDYLDSDREL